MLRRTGEHSLQVRIGQAGREIVGKVPALRQARRQAHEPHRGNADLARHVGNVNYGEEVEGLEQRLRPQRPWPFALSPEICKELA